MTETIVVAKKSAASWTPVRGIATDALGKLLVEDRRELPDTDAFDRIVASSIDIVGRCKPMNAQDGARTGLVVGYVQSGKTMSMTTVASIARDSGCRLVILLAGVTELLLKQTARTRLKPYLVNQPEPRCGWKMIDTVDSVDLEKRAAELQSWITQWRDESVPENRQRPLFITVMKNHSHLDHLHSLLTAKGVDLRGIPALILDDEADQAGLDTNAARRAAGKATESSTTYRRIFAIRNALKNHTYLQYTATPQAPLLISLADILSPHFATVLEPGAGYTGGKAFFQGSNGLVDTLPEEALFPIGSAPDEPPDSLVKAMREFFVGVAAGVARSEKGKRSMLIHPSSRKNDQEVFSLFARTIKNGWETDLRNKSTPELRKETLDEFKESYDDLAKTAKDLPPFDQIAAELVHALSDTPVWLVNSEDGNEVDWDHGYSHVLVGGDKLNRGFTVEGLTVTYMPRSPGGWNADTIQQRARFFGYKAKYLGLCRIYLHPEVEDAYREYVDHEEDIRGQLKSHEGKPLKEWKRHFLMDHRLHATRTNVLSETVHKPKAADWFRQSYPHAVPDRIAGNQASISKLIGLAQKWRDYPGFPQHEMASVPLDRVFETFVIEYECFEADTAPWTGLVLWLAELRRKKPGASVSIVRMGKGAVRERGEADSGSGRIGQLFEGRRPKTGKATYPGDEEIFDGSEDVVTIQIHVLDVMEKDEAKRKERTCLHANVPAIAVRLPADFAPKDIAVQAKRKS